MFTHTARDDAEAACRHVFRGEDRSVAGRVGRHAVFTDPEVGAVGRRDFAGVAKARAIGSTVGVIKFVLDRATRTGSSAATSLAPKPATSCTRPSSHGHRCHPQ